ncbi:unnamed protein product [Mucor hiemalis]
MLANGQSKAYYYQPQHNSTRKRLATSKFVRIFKCLLIPCHCRRRTRTTIQEICTCIQTETPSKSSDSFTIIDDYSQQQPWIVPSGYHKNMLSNSPDNRNQWIFRTGWTPQPDPLALVHNGWCNSCGSCVKKELVQCPFCGIQPLITTRQVSSEIQGKN